MWSEFKGFLLKTNALALAVGVIIGGALGTVAEATTADPAPSTGRTYQVDGHSLYLDCVGTGEPTVVLFNGLGARTPSWAWVREAVSSSSRACVFDRAGQGWSGAAPGPQDGPALAADVHGLLGAAGIEPPSDPNDTQGSLICFLMFSSDIMK